MNFAFPFSILISKIRLVISANSSESFRLPLTASSREPLSSFPILKMECWLQEFADSFYDPAFMELPWNRGMWG